MLEREASERSWEEKRGCIVVRIVRAEEVGVLKFR